MLNKILSLFLKPNCPLCDRPADDIVCNYCQRQLESCKISNRSQYWQGELPLFVWGEYEGKLKRAIASLKYDQHPDLGELMGLWLGKTWRDSQIYSQKHSQGTSEMGTSEMKRLEMKRLTVVPIPLHKKKQAERGFNQAEIIARGFCQITGYHLQAQGLARVKATKAMFGLNPEEREKNLKNALSLGQDFTKKLPKNPVLIIDDIYTTGTTVKTAAKILREKGVKVVGVGAIATGAKKPQPGKPELGKM